MQLEIARVEAEVRTLTNRIDDLVELAGHGTEDDRRALMSRVRAAMSERTSCQLELTRLRKSQTAQSEVITPEAVRSVRPRQVSDRNEAVWTGNAKSWPTQHGGP